MTPEQRQAWLEERRTGIGGSDAAAACGMSKWKTPLELYLDKRGELETAESEPMKWGTLLEPIVRQEYANRTGRTVVVPPGIIRHPVHSFAIVTADGIADESRYYEGKTARTADGWGEPGTGEIPQDYLLQVQHGMFVTGLPVADVAVLVGGSDFRLYVVEADAELQAMLIDQERAFWHRVLAADPPEPMTAEDVKRRWRYSSGQRMDADREAVEACELLATLKAHARAYDSAVEQVTTAIQARMQSADDLVDDGGNVLATWKNIKAGTRFDLERFKSEQPELFKSYLRDAAPQRRFLLKVKGPECPLPLPNAPQLPKLELAAAES